MILVAYLLAGWVLLAVAALVDRHSRRRFVSGRIADLRGPSAAWFVVSLLAGLTGFLLLMSAGFLAWPSRTEYLNGAFPPLQPVPRWLVVSGIVSAVAGAAGFLVLLLFAPTSDLDVSERHNRWEKRVLLLSAALGIVVPVVASLSAPNNPYQGRPLILSGITAMSGLWEWHRNWRPL